jgi:hypothetical protein
VSKTIISIWERIGPFFFCKEIAGLLAFFHLNITAEFSILFLTPLFVVSYLLTVISERGHSHFHMSLILVFRWILMALEYIKMSYMKSLMILKFTSPCKFFSTFLEIWMQAWPFWLFLHHVYIRISAYEVKAGCLVLTGSIILPCLSS